MLTEEEQQLRSIFERSEGSCNYFFTEEEIKAQVKYLLSGSIITEEDFDTKQFDRYFEGYLYFIRSGKYSRAQIDGLFEKYYSKYECKTVALFRCYIELKRALFDTITLYLENLSYISANLTEVHLSEDGHWVELPMRTGAFESAVLLYSLACRFLFAKDETEKAQIKEKIKFAKALHEKCLKPYIELYNNPKQSLWNPDELEVQNKVNLAKIVNNAWFYENLEKIISYGRTMKNFMDLNKLTDIDDVAEFLHDSFIFDKRQEKHYEDEYSANHATPQKFDEYNFWGKYEVKYPLNDKNFKAESPTPGFNHSLAEKFGYFDHKWDM